MLYILINDYILKVKKNKKYSFPENREGLDIGCGYNLIDSFIGLDGNFLIYLMKKKLPRIIKEKIYNKTSTSKIFPFENFFEVILPKKIIHHNILFGIPFENCTVPNIFTSHFIEHLTKEQGEKFLEECYRVLKIKGILRIVCPDLDKEIAIIKKDLIKYQQDRISEPVQKYVTTEIITNTKNYNKFSSHRHSYSFEELKSILLKIGFKDIIQHKYQSGKIPYVKELDRTKRLSLFLEAIK